MHHDYSSLLNRTNKNIVPINRMSAHVAGDWIWTLIIISQVRRGQLNGWSSYVNGTDHHCVAVCVQTV